LLSLAALRALPSFPTRRSSDLAGAARELAASGDRTSAAIASRAAGERYGLTVAAADIQDSDHNMTRFAILAPAGVDRVPERGWRSEEHTSELQSRENLVCRLLL